MYTPPPTKRPGHPRRALSSEQRAAIVEALKAGGSVTSVAARFGLDRATVRRFRDGTGSSAPASSAASVVVTVRLSVPEARAFDAHVSGLGLGSRSEGLRAAVRAATGLLEFSGEEHDRLDALTRALNRIGVNINQLVRLANSGRLPIGDRQLNVLSDLRSDLAQLRAFMADLAAERRRKGLRLFERFVREEARNG